MRCGDFLCVSTAVKNVGRHRVVCSCALTAQRRKLQRKSEHTFLCSKTLFPPFMS